MYFFFLNITYKAYITHNFSVFCLILIFPVFSVSTSTALKLTFDLWPEMRKHIEIIPRTGFLQAQSSFTAHLKFVPRYRTHSKDAAIIESLEQSQSNFYFSLGLLILTFCEYLKERTCTGFVPQSQSAVISEKLIHQKRTQYD